MNISINGRKFPITEEHRRYIKRRADFALSHHADIIQSVKVQITDVNGPKGGRDLECKIIIPLSGAKDVIIKEQQAEIKHAIDRAMFRASHALMQQMKRKSARAAKLSRSLHLADVG